MMLFFMHTFSRFCMFFSTIVLRTIVLRVVHSVAKRAGGATNNNYAAISLSLTPLLQAV